jgi:PRTRC genetic system protein C
MKTTTLEREFRYNGAKLTDPSPAFSLQQVRDFYANTYPEIVNAEIEGPEVIGNRNVFTFRRAVGTKGITSEKIAVPMDTLERDGKVIARVGVLVDANDDEQLNVRSRIEAIRNSGKNIAPAIRVYLDEIDRFASAHVCPLLDEEIAFVGALYARYVS